ncbi:uncharacterized protein B0I36DRAFT_101265 [Microdochium trichocladiopsis]|uniref:Secreted protein n=1 Tax=Microdochium trichocladiopsis TaxID=1682393 RepID=A0A9P8YB27_9PEZI|nr:uncharacterized protein B0I36DRAFT_101265 [Microdochium trichocladiopsis]KAH7032843.1 hypothetical protein B0I36DRAFT_101265 [Microdochium trichocladiopsis]
MALSLFAMVFVRWLSVTSLKREREESVCVCACVRACVFDRLSISRRRYSRIDSPFCKERKTAYRAEFLIGGKVPSLSTSVLVALPVLVKATIASSANARLEESLSLGGLRMTSVQP